MGDIGDARFHSVDGGLGCRETGVKIVGPNVNILCQSGTSVTEGTDSRCWTHPL